MVDTLTDERRPQFWGLAPSEARSSAVALALLAVLQTPAKVAAVLEPIAPTSESTRPPSGSAARVEVPRPSADVQGLWAGFQEISRLERGWDGEDADPPNGAALDNMHAVLDALIGSALVADRVVPSVDGGISAYFFFRGRGHVSIHCDNEGAIVVIDDDPKLAVRAVEVDRESVEIVEAFVTARSALG